MLNRLFPPETRRRAAGAIRASLDWFRRWAPPGTRLPAGLVLMTGGAFGFLPVLGFWMIPLGVAVAMLDIGPAWRWLRRQSSAAPLPEPGNQRQSHETAAHAGQDEEPAEQQKVEGAGHQ